MTAGYSGTPLINKLGIKSGFVICIVNAPNYYFDIVGEMPSGVRLAKEGEKVDFAHLFVTKLVGLEESIVYLRKALVPNGMIWVSWPKKSSKITSEITENIVRSLALSNGLVDIKVCAVDDVWSALKLVIPIKDR